MLYLKSNLNIEKYSANSNLPVESGCDKSYPDLLLKSRFKVYVFFFLKYIFIISVCIMTNHTCDSSPNTFLIESYHINNNF